MKSAFDTLAEGLLIVDERGVILLANDAFVQKLQPYEDAIEGASVFDLPWEFLGKFNQDELPWQTALRTGAPILVLKSDFGAAMASYGVSVSTRHRLRTAKNRYAASL